MSENEPAPRPLPENETVNVLPTEEIKDKPIDWESLKLGVRAVAVISALALGATYGAELYLGAGDDSKSNTTPAASSSQYPGAEETQRATLGKKECREVRGILRVVGVNAEQMKTIHDQDDVGKIPHMYHQRDDDGHKADVEFEWRIDPNRVTLGEDSAFYTAAKYHFRPFTERSDEPMLNAKDVIIPDNAFNLDGAVGEIVQIGHMKVSTTE